MEGKFVSWGESIFQSRTGWKSNKSDLHLNDPCWIYFEAYVQNPKWVGIEYNLTFRLILPKQNQKHRAKPYTAYKRFTLDLRTHIGSK